MKIRHIMLTGRQSPPCQVCGKKTPEMVSKEKGYMHGDRYGILCMGCYLVDRTTEPEPRRERVKAYPRDIPIARSREERQTFKRTYRLIVGAQYNELSSGAGESMVPIHDLANEAGISCTLLKIWGKEAWAAENVV